MGNSLESVIQLLYLFAPQRAAPPGRIAHARACKNVGGKKEVALSISYTSYKLQFFYSAYTALLDRSDSLTLSHKFVLSMPIRETTFLGDSPCSDKSFIATSFFPFFFFLSDVLNHQLILGKFFCLLWTVFGSLPCL